MTQRTGDEVDRFQRGRNGALIGEGSSGGRTEITIDQLYNELRSNGSGSDGMDVRLTPEQRSEVLLERVVTTLFEDGEFSFRESSIKEHLDEILLVLVAHRSADTHGKSLMGDLAAIFDARLSPGTVYPTLHGLEEDGLLDAQELVQTKEYQVSDEEEMVERVRDAMEQHLVLGYFFWSSLAELSA
jgi:DNA-binding PadR family transcriptional regulator